MNRVIHSHTGEIDWAELRRKVAVAFDASPDSVRTSPERARAVLEERARRLAQSAVEIGQPAATYEILSFRLGRELYGLETRFAREVVRLTDYTAIPGTPDFVIGVMNLRGDIIPVFDLMRFFGFQSQGLTDRSRVIVVGTLVPEFGIIADSVLEVSKLPLSEFMPDPIFEGTRGQECIRGVTRSAMIVLEGSALIADQRLFINSANHTDQ